MGKQKTSKSYNAPGFASQAAPVAEKARDWFMQEGFEESPFYSDLSRMYSNTLGSMGDRFELPPWISQTLEEAATTGLKTMTPLEQTPYYQAVMPEYQRRISEDIIPQFRENFGVTGGLRSSDYAESASRGASQAMGDMIMQAAMQAYQAEEAAKARQLQGAMGGLQATGIPYDIMLKSIAGAAGLSQEQLPYLNEVLQFLGLSAGQMGKSSGYVSGGQQAGQSANAGMGAAGQACCFIFIEGEGELTQVVREYRDEHFGHDSYVADGYRAMAKVLVPIMRRSNLVKNIIKYIMTKPLTKVAENYYELNSYGYIFKPLAHFWTGVWSLIGRTKEAINGNSPRHYTLSDSKT